MTVKEMKSLTLVGLPGESPNDSYRMEVPEVDNTLSVQGAAADAKKVGDELTDLKSDFTDLGLTIANGVICITFEEVAV